MWPKERLEKEFNTSFESGLTSATAAELLKVKGPNQLTEKGKTPAIIVFLKEQIGIYRTVGIILAFVGVIVIVLEPDQFTFTIGAISVV